MLLFIVSNILGSSIQITTLPLVILSPLQASGLVFNSICATLILSEPFTRYSLVGTILVCVGATLIAAFGAMKEPAHTLDELLVLLGKKPFLLWMGGQVLLVGSILMAAKASHAVSSRTKNMPKIRLMRGIAYGCVSGILSAHCLLLAKSAVELLVRTIVDRVNQFNRWQSWIILVGLVTLALTQLFYLHRGLKLVSTSVLYPLVFCVYNIIAILDGLLYYQQTSRLSPLYGGLIALGTFILLSGVLALSWRLQDDSISQPPKTAGVLAPGSFTFVDTDSETDTNSDLDSTYHDNPPPQAPGPPHLRKTENDLHSSPLTRVGRRRALSQAEEIWGELQDDDSSVSPRISRANTMMLDEEAVVDERTGLLQHRPRRKLIGRRHSYGFPTRFSNISSFRRASAAPAQEATGGWWKLHWWKGDDRRLEEEDEI